MEKYLFATRKLISSPRILQRKLTLTVSSTDQLNEPLKVAKNSFQEPMPNSPLPLSHLCFGVRFVFFILAFWLRCMLLPWQRGWLKTRLKKGIRTTRPLDNSPQTTRPRSSDNSTPIWKHQCYVGKIYFYAQKGIISWVVHYETKTYVCSLRL